MFKKQNNMTVMDFTGIYENEKFYKHKNIRWLDLHELQGVYGYCSQEARRTIEAKISNLSPEGIHFIDSGNFHYVSEFWIEKMKHDFILVVFDHHSDMMQPLFDDILSCGSWILNSLENNKYLKITICDETKSIFNSVIRKLKTVSDIDILDVSHMSRKVIKQGTEDINIEYFYTEISLSDVDKWTAIEYLINQLNIKKEEVVAIRR